MERSYSHVYAKDLRGLSVQGMLQAVKGKMLPDFAVVITSESLMMIENAMHAEKMRLHADEIDQIRHGEYERGYNQGYKDGYEDGVDD